MSNTINLPPKKDPKKEKKWKFTKMFRHGKSDSIDSKIKDVAVCDSPAPGEKSKRTRAVTTLHGASNSMVQSPGKVLPFPQSKSIECLKDEVKHEPMEIPAKKKVKPQFGVPLVKLSELFPEEPVPAVLVECIKILENDIRKEGIFRIPGRMTSIVEMKNSFEDGKGLGVEEPNTLEIAGLVAQFFRELPEPLLTYDLYYNWVDAAKKENEEKIRENIVELLKQIPEANYNTLKCFTAFLVNVSKNSGANRMGARNLALVFGASLLNPPSIDQYDLMNIKLQCSVIEHMITSYSFIFEGIDSESATKVREKQVATIPAGNPALNQSTPVPPADRRKGFMKRKSTFFATSQYSGNSSRIQDFITPIRSFATKKASEEPSEKIKKEEKPCTVSAQSEGKKKRKRKKKRSVKAKRTRSSDLYSEPTETKEAPTTQEEDNTEAVQTKVHFKEEKDDTPQPEESSTIGIILSETDIPDIEVVDPPSISDGDEEDAEDEVYDESTDSDIAFSEKEKEDENVETIETPTETS